VRVRTVGTTLGIDLGTTHTVALLAGPDRPARPLLFDSSPLLASAVFAAEDGRLLVGRDAERRARLAPERFEPNPKRRIDEGRVLLGTSEYPVVDLLAAVLGRVGAEAVRVAGGPSDTVLTYPATWAGPRRQILTQAAEGAGLGRPVLVPEPVAAAVYFTTVLGHTLAPGEALAVYDFGAGTFDTGVVRRQADGWQVLAADGLDTVGGADLDAAVVDWVGRQLAPGDPARWGRLARPGTGDDRRHLLLLQQEARVAKEQLSRESTAMIRVPLFDVDLPLTREEFERLARPLLDQTVTLTAATMFRAGLRHDEIAGLFLVGGSSRIPLAATLLHQRLHIAPTVIEQPELVVAQGSVLMATEGTPVEPTSGGPAPAPPGSPGPVTDPAGSPVPSAPSERPRPSPVAGRARRPAAILVAVLLALPLIVYGIGKIADGGTGRDNGNGTGTSPGADGDPAQKVDAPPGGQAVNLDRTVWYRGLRLAFTRAVFTPPRSEGGRGQLTVTVAIENLSVQSFNQSLKATYSSSRQQHTTGFLDDVTVPAKGRSPGSFTFEPTADAVGDLRTGVINVGEDESVKAVVPLDPGGTATTLEPVPLVSGITKTVGNLRFGPATCVLRADIVDFNEVYSHREAKDGFRLVTCQLTVALAGGTRARVGKENFRLKQPDGETIAPDEYPYGTVESGESLLDKWLFFTVRYPARPGGYVLQMLYLGPGGGDSPSPANTVEIPLTPA
jgi:hypothetical protein